MLPSSDVHRRSQIPFCDLSNLSNWCDIRRLVNTINYSYKIKNNSVRDLGLLSEYKLTF